MRRRRQTTFSYGSRQIAQRRLTYYRLKRKASEVVAELVARLPRGFREYDLLP